MNENDFILAMEESKKLYQNARRRFLVTCRKNGYDPYVVEKNLNKNFKGLVNIEELFSYFEGTYENLEKFAENYSNAYMVNASLKMHELCQNIPSSIVDRFVEYKMLLKMYDISFGCYLLLKD